ncbi:MAG: MFS transporter [Actinobacteria bacterium]|nr:MFS transporter [Actinomycetota bacterium]
MTQLKELKAHKGFSSLILSRFISNIGNGLSPIALAYGVLGIKGSDGSDLSFVMAARILPMVALMLVGGVIGDRYKRNRVVGGADMIGSFFAAVSAISFLAGFPSVGLLALMGALFGVLNALWWPAMSGVLPEILPKEKLKDGNAVVGLLSNIGFVLGALIGGTLVSLFGPGWALLADAVSFFVAGILVWNLELPAMPKREKNSMLHDLKVGWKEFISRSWVVTMVFTFTIINACYEAMIQVLGPLAFNKGNTGPRYWSYNLAAFTIGMTLGGILALRVKFPRPLAISMVLIAATSVWDFSLALNSSLVIALLCACFSGFAIEIFMVAWNTAMQTNIPEESYSRVVAYDAFGSYAIAPIGIAIAGPLAAHFGISEALWVTGALTLVSALLSLTVKSVRTLR